MSMGGLHHDLASGHVPYLEPPVCCHDAHACCRVRGVCSLVQPRLCVHLRWRKKYLFAECVEAKERRRGGNQSIKQPINQSINHPSINKSAQQSFNQSIKQSINQAISQSSKHTT
jgi:hypothetical protein